MKIKDKRKSATRILAGILAGLMVMGSVISVLYVIFTAN